MTVFRRNALDPRTPLAKGIGSIAPEQRQADLRSLTLELMLHGRVDEAVYFAGHRVAEWSPPEWAAKFALLEALLAPEAGG